MNKTETIDLETIEVAQLAIVQGGIQITLTPEQLKRQLQWLDMHLPPQ